MMSAELLFGLILSIAIFLFLIIIGNELFTIMIDEQTRYLRLILYYAPFPVISGISQYPETVRKYAERALGENRDPVECVHIRHAGRIRYGKTGRWMNMNGEAVFSLATPAYVWHTTIFWFPGIWIDAFEYYVHQSAGMHLNLFSIIPLESSWGEESRPLALFWYLASVPLFPMALATSGPIFWQTVNHSAAKAIIRDTDLDVEAFARFNNLGGIERMKTCDKTHPATGKRLPGHISSRFSSYAEVEGYWIPMLVESDIALPSGKLLHAEYFITDIRFGSPEPVHEVIS